MVSSQDQTKNSLSFDARIPIAALSEAISQRIIGQKLLIDRLVMALILDQHVLLEGLPGLAKTTAVKALADATGLVAKRVQFTPDLMPSDLIGSQIYDPKTMQFVVRKGPVFANLLIADEINRAPAKVQSALLEAMQEKQVTIGEETHKLPEPFVVLATQNPLEQEGTFPLPEAQMDRFLFKVVVGYPSAEEELKILANVIQPTTSAIVPVLNRGVLDQLRNSIDAIHVSQDLRKYIVQLVQATRNLGSHGLTEFQGCIRFGASPRASIGLELASRAQALMNGRAFVTPQDVKDVALDVLRHRLLLTVDAEVDGITTDVIVAKLLNSVKIP